MKSINALDYSVIKNEFENSGLELLTEEKDYVSDIKTKLKYLCKVHGVQEVWWNNFHHSKKCAKCAHEECKKNRRKSFDEILEYCKYKSFSIISKESEYTNAHDYCIRCNCPKHGEFKLSWSRIMQGRGCPKCSMSYGASKIAEMLKANGHSYVTEKTFETCRTPNGHGKCRFDFYVDERYLIEYDGEQHYMNVAAKFRGMTYKERQDIDFYKSKWAIENKIPIIRIDFRQIKDISIQDLVPETSDYLVRSRIGALALYLE
jgi:hypothetical protein